MSAKAPRVFFREAIARAIAEAMRADPRVIVLGQDVGAFGGAYREFEGLYAEFGGARVRDTPVAEAAIMGIGVGAAAAGYRTLVSITYMDFVMLALDPLVNYAAKLRFKTAGRLTAPVVLKTTAGARGQGVAHSQCLESWLMSVPGLTVVAPSNPADAYGLMRSALRADGPVVFVDHKRLYPIPGNAPASDVPVPFGQARIARPGTDITITAHSFMVQVALTAADALAKEGLSVEVVDLRSLAPLDIDTIAASVSRTGALLTVEEGQLTCGVGAEVAARLRERQGGLNVARVGAIAAPVSSNHVLEAAAIPDVERVAQGVRALLRARESGHPNSVCSGGGPGAV
ncbi:MAG TPA: transketolase C-terminal domain-containing protein [Caulobacteraceae bacterium]